MLSKERISVLAGNSGLASPSIVIAELPSGAAAHGRLPQWFELQADLPLSPASMVKVPLAAALCAAWENGERRREDRVVINSVNLTTNDAASPLVPGYTATLEELGVLMLTRSDNVATNELIDILGRNAATAYLHSLGLRATFVRHKLSGDLPLIDDPGATGYNAHPARDAALLFKRIAQQELLGADWLREVLCKQEWNQKLSLGLRPGDSFAHKTGDTNEATHDGGILQTVEGKRFIVVVYTSLRSSPENDTRMAAFMEALRPELV